MPVSFPNDSANSTEAPSGRSAETSESSTTSNQPSKSSSHTESSGQSGSNSSSASRDRSGNKTKSTSSSVGSKSSGKPGVLEDFADFSNYYREKVLLRSGGWIWDVLSLLAGMTGIYETIWSVVLLAGAWVVLRTSSIETSLILGLAFDLTIPLQYYLHPHPVGQRTHLTEYWPIFGIATAAELACLFVLEPTTCTLVVCIKTLLTTSVWMGSTRGVFWTAYITGTARSSSSSSTGSSSASSSRRSGPSGGTNSSGPSSSSAPTSSSHRPARDPSEPTRSDTTPTPKQTSARPPVRPPLSDPESTKTKKKKKHRGPVLSPDQATLNEWTRKLLTAGYSDGAVNNLVRGLSAVFTCNGEDAAISKLEGENADKGTLGFLKRRGRYLKSTIALWENGLPDDRWKALVRRAEKWRRGAREGNTPPSSSSEKDDEIPSTTEDSAQSESDSASIRRQRRRYES